LAEARADIARAEGLARQASALPNPRLGVEMENFSGSGPFRGTNLAETTASIEQMVELGGKRSARIGAGRADLAAARARARRTQSEFTFDLAVAYAEAEASERRLKLAADSLALAEEDARIARALVEAGREADLRRVQAKAAVQAARAGVDETRASRETAFADLTALAGAAAPITSIKFSLLDQEAPLFVPAEVEIGKLPGVEAAEAERVAAERRLRLERARVVPDLTVSVGVRRFQEGDATAMVAGVTAPFPLFDRNRGNVGAARAEVSAAEARLSQAKLEAEASARSAVIRRAAAETRVVAARDGEQTAQEAYRLTRTGYEGGKLGLTELINARRALTDARAQSIQAAVERVNAQAALARLTGAQAFGEQQ
jgi:cobalt-zinc-cadmium efflux system outer membrane protein